MTILDISLALDGTTPRWPGDPECARDLILSRERGDAVNASALRCSAHAGTHVDAPCHHLSGGAGVEALPLDVLVGDAIVVDLGNAASIGPAELDAAAIPPGTTRLLCRTANSRRRLWSDSAFHPEFVALSPAGAVWLVNHGVRLIGVDYLSVQAFHDPTNDTHLTLLTAGVVIVEGLDLTAAAAGRFHLVCLPVKLKGSDGAPARAILLPLSTGDAAR